MAQAATAPLMDAPGRQKLAGHWERVWQKARQGSLLSGSQKLSRARWQEFYSRVCDLYAPVAGHDCQMGRAISDHLVQGGLAAPGGAVLDLGCGSGALALPLARAGSRVTALDCNREMLAALGRQAAHLGLRNLETLCRSWDDLGQTRLYDLVLASWFPEVLSPRGLMAMESHSKGCCALVLGTGHEAFAFRRRIWERVLEQTWPTGGFHLECATGWLAASGRQPQLSKLAWPVQFRQPMSKVLAFYQSYFAIFDCDPTRVEEVVRGELRLRTRDGLVTARGREEAAVLWWRSPTRAQEQTTGGRKCAA